MHLSAPVSAGHLDITRRLITGRQSNSERVGHINLSDWLQGLISTTSIISTVRGIAKRCLTFWTCLDRPTERLDPASYTALINAIIIW